MLKCARIGETLRQARLARGLSRNAVRCQIGYANATYARIEAGTSLPQPVEAAAIAQWLGIDQALVRQQIEAELAQRCAERRPAPSPTPPIDPGAPDAEVHAAQPSTAGAP